MNPPTESILALDYGSAHMGVAFARGGFVTTLPVLPVDGFLLPRLMAIIQEESVKDVVIGLPEEPQRKVVERFIAALKEKFDGNVIPWDETLTSLEATALLRDNRKKGSREDSAAAALLLREYLDNGSTVS